MDQTHTCTAKAALHAGSFVALHLLVLGLLLLLLTLTATPAAIKLPLWKCLPRCGYRFHKRGNLTNQVAHTE